MFYYSMFRMFTAVIMSCLFAYAIIYGFLSLVCELSEHDGLIMMHLQFSSVVLSILFGFVKSVNVSVLKNYLSHP